MAVCSGEDRFPYKRGRGINFLLVDHLKFVMERIRFAPLIMRIFADRDQNTPLLKLLTPVTLRKAIKETERGLLLPFEIDLKTNLHGE